MSGSNALQITDPNADNPLAQGPRQPFQPWTEFEKDEPPMEDTGFGYSKLELWLAEQRAKNAANSYESLPGITSGAPPKPWGLDRTQLPQQPQPQPYQSGFIANVLNRFRPMDLTADPGMTVGDDKMPGTLSRTPVIMNERPQWKYRET